MHSAFSEALSTSWGYQASWPFVIITGEERKEKNVRKRTYLFWRPVALSDISAVIQESKDLLDASLFLEKFLHLETLATSPCELLDGLKTLLCELNILDAQLLADDGQISDWINISLYVNDFGIVETSYDLEDSIDGTNVGQESISKTSTRRSTSCQTSNIINSEMCRDSRFWVVFLAEPLISLIRDEDTRLFGLDGCEGKVLVLSA